MHTPLKKVPLDYKKNGFSLVELTVGIVVVSVVALMSLSYLTVYLKTIRHSEGYISQEETSHLIEKFFNNPSFCTETMKKAESSVIPGGELTIDPNTHAPSEAKGLFESWKRGLNGNIKVSFFPLKNNMDLAQIQWTLSAKAQGNLQARDKSFWVEVLRDNQGKISNCLKAEESTQACKAGFQHILSYDTSSLKPITSTLIEEPGTHGKSYKTLTKNTYEGGKELYCMSHTHCHKGDWQNQLWCYNYCTDSVYSTGDEGYRSLSSNKNCSGGTGQGQTVKCQKAKKSWCSAEVLSHPPCSIELKDFCEEDRSSPPVGSYSSDSVRAVCQGPRKLNISGKVSLPEGNYGDAVPILKKARKEGMDFGYLSLYAFCDYIGKWHIMGMTCDTAPRTGTGGKPKNEWGRATRAGKCAPKYPPSNGLTCSSGKSVTLHPGKSSDSKGPIPPKNKKLKDIFEHQIENRVAHGAPLRFMYDFDGRSPTTYTAFCNSKTGNFEIAEKSDFCEAQDRGSPKLDMVFVIDDSPSMYHEQALMADNLNNFFNEFLTDEIDTHIALVTTDFDNYILKNLIPGGFLCNKEGCQGRKASIPDIQNELATKVRNAGIEGSSDEHFFEPIIKLKSRFPKFFRPQAALALFFLTDEDTRESPEEMIDFLFSSDSNFKRSPQKTIAFIAVNEGTSSDNNNPDPNCDSYKDPSSLRKFMRLMDERKLNLSNPLPTDYKSDNEVDLCSPHFSERLTQFGVNLSSLLQTSKPPRRPAALDVLDTVSLPQPLKDPSTGASLLFCP